MLKSLWYIMTTRQEK